MVEWLCGSVGLTLVLILAHGQKGLGCECEVFSRLLALKRGEKKKIAWQLILGIMFQNTSKPDDTAGTYITYYLLSLECIILAVALFFRCAAIPAMQTSHAFPFNIIGCIGFFLFCGLNAFVMGWLHEYYHTWDHSEPEEFFTLWHCATVAAILQATCMFYLGETLRQIRNIGSLNAKNQAVNNNMMNGVITICTLAMVISLTSMPHHRHEKEVATFIFTLVMSVYLLAISITDTATTSRQINSSSRHFITAIGFYALILILFFALDSICSEAKAFETAGCPLPDQFNHQALANVFSMLIVLLLGAGGMQLMEDDKFPVDLFVSKQAM
jgi:hypothetical protein